MYITSEPQEWTPIDPNLENELLNAYARIEELEGKMKSLADSMAPAPSIKCGVITAAEILRDSILTPEQYEKYVQDGTLNPDKARALNIRVYKLLTGRVVEK